MKRFIILVLDSVGVGELPDADQYGDTGSNTLGNTAKAVNGLSLPNLERLGLGNIISIQGVNYINKPSAAWGKMAQKSAGKDTTTGHWEIAGLTVEQPFPTYPNGFPPEIINKFEKAIGRKSLGNVVASGTEIIKELGPQHLETGYPIIYTSADSVFQIAAHEDIVPVETLYQWCESAREILTGKYGVGRVIARPFIGKPGNFTRTANRKDFSLSPSKKTVLVHLNNNNIPVFSVGKIKDIFAGQGICESTSSKNNMDTIDKTIALLHQKQEECLIFANCVDFDMLWGHRNNYQAYAQGLEEFDTRVPEIITSLTENDVLCILADHGCDPTTKSTDHSREYVPLLVYGNKISPRNLGIRNTFSDVAQSVSDFFNIQQIFSGSSFMKNIPDYQLSAFCMAVYFQGMDPEETTHLTMTMANSGSILDLSPIKGKVIDKHSTGGVGDTTTLVLAPLVASCGIPVAKMSGRGLGHTGGTIDKLESIPGFKAELSENDFIKQVNKVKASIVGQTKELAPADKSLYALRDVTGTVESIPLIASSIMSKKIAAGANGLVLDVKTGKGAFMSELNQAILLAKIMVQIGHNLDKPTVALITDMNQPLGKHIGNSLEVKEAIATLNGEGPEDLQELCLLLGTEMIMLADNSASRNSVRKLLEKNLNNKKGLNTFKEIIKAQGGNASVIDDLSLLPQASGSKDVLADQNGYIHEIDSLVVGLTAMNLGAGRVTKDSIIDPAVGIELKKKIGNSVKKGEALATIYYNEDSSLDELTQKLKLAFKVKSTIPKKSSLLLKKISIEDV